MEEMTKLEQLTAERNALHGEVVVLREALEVSERCVAHRGHYCARAAGKVMLLRNALQELVDIIQSMIDDDENPSAIDSFTLQPARQALIEGTGKPEADVIAAAEHEFADPEFGDVSYDLGQIVAKWDGRILEELAEQFVAYLQKSGYPRTVQTVECMKEARK